MIDKTKMSYQNILKVEGYSGKHKAFTEEWWIDIPHTLQSLFLTNLAISKTRADDEGLDLVVYVDTMKPYLDSYNEDGNVCIECYTSDILKQLKDLKDFFIIESDITTEELSFISEMKNLESLQLINCFKLKNLNFIKPLNSLQCISLEINYSIGGHSDTGILNLDILKGNKLIKELNLSGRIDIDLTFTNYIENLEVLNLSQNILENVDILIGCVNLKELDLSYNDLKRIDGLDKIKSLKKLDIKDNDIVSLSPLELCKKLEVLDVSFNYISTLDSIKQLINLNTLNIEHNYITSIRGLNSLPKLKELNLMDNDIIDYLELITFNNIDNLKTGVDEYYLQKYLIPITKHIKNVENSIYKIFTLKRRHSYELEKMLDYSTKEEVIKYCIDNEVNDSLRDYYFDIYN